MKRLLTWGRHSFCCLSANQDQTGCLARVTATHLGPGLFECPTFGRGHTIQSAWALKKVAFGWTQRKWRVFQIEGEARTKAGLQSREWGWTVCQRVRVGSGGVKGAWCATLGGKLLGLKMKENLEYHVFALNWKVHRAILRLAKSLCHYLLLRFWTWYISWLRCSDFVWY